MSVIQFSTAGGIVVHDGRVLVLRSSRYDHLRLPKGHIEEGETIRAAALREVCEETGYADLEIVTDLGEQDAEFDSPAGHVIRHEHYFLMRLSSERRVRRKTDDISFTPEWVSWGGAVKDMAYDEERRWVFAARAWFGEEEV
ncbi:MAG: NUDIX domain-containing protein [Anaerolineae bacterium]